MKKLVKTLKPIFLLILLVAISSFSGCEYSTYQTYKLPLMRVGNSHYSQFGAEVGPITTFPEETRGDLMKRVIIRVPGDILPANVSFVPPMINRPSCGGIWYNPVNNPFYSRNQQMQFQLHRVGDHYEFIFEHNYMTLGNCYIRNLWDGIWRLDISYPIHISSEYRTVRYVEIEIVWEPQ